MLPHFPILTADVYAMLSCQSELILFVEWEYRLIKELVSELKPRSMISYVDFKPNAHPCAKVQFSKACWSLRVKH